MAGRRRGLGPLWALGGAALGVCLAGVAGQLVEVRPGGRGGSEWLSPSGRAGADAGGAYLTGSPLFPSLCPGTPGLME